MAALASKNDRTKSYAKTQPLKKRQGLSKWEKIAIPLIIIIGIWAVYSFTQPAPATSSSLSNTVSTTLSQSNTAPDFTLPIVGNGPGGLTGQTLTLSALQGKIVLLEFMEPWCPHCQHMAPILQSLYQQYGKGNVVFISVAGPWNGATASDAASFIGTYGTNWTFVYDSSGTIFSDYGVNSTPTFYIIGASGQVITNFVGEQTLDTLSGALSAAGGT